MRDIVRDVANLKAKQEAKLSNARQLDTRSRILAARRRPPAPAHTRAELEKLAQDTGVAGRIARGWLRIGFTLAKRARGAAPAIDPDIVLPAMAGYFFDKPLQFVLFAFEWDCDRSLQVVKLPEGLQLVYDCEFGPDAWACDLLEEIGAQETARAFDGAKAVPPIRVAVSSGHGIGKSAFSAWLILWLMLRPGARGVVTANTSQQLSSRTWSELQKWNKRSVFGTWYDITTGAQMKMVMREHAESWAVFGQTCREENSESFAGLHAADSSAFMVFDEASAIPSKIWETAEGAMTDGAPVWLALSNPTRPNGTFFECFGAQRHRWTTRKLDSRTAQITNKELLNQWIADYGIGSDFCRVRIIGEFPSMSSMQFIGREVVDAAAQRQVPEQRGEAVVIGVDPARFGDDQSVIWTRQGRDARSTEPIRMRQVDTMTLASRVAEHINLMRSTGRFVVCNVDGGGVGGGVVDRLRSLGFDVNEVQFGGKASDPKKWGNRRAEIWGAMREWLAGGAIPRDEGLVSDLTSVEYGFNAADQILLERKESMKSRGLASPDSADALALTFAVPTPIAGPDGEVLDGRGWTKPYREPQRFNYDPIAHFEAEMRARAK